MSILGGLRAVQNQKYFPPNMQPTPVWHFRMCIWLWHANKGSHANGIQFSGIATTNQHLDQGWNELDWPMMQSSCYVYSHCYKMESWGTLFFFLELFQNCVVLDFQGLRNYFKKVWEIILHFFSQNHILGPLFFKSYASPREILPLALIGSRKF